MKNSKIFLSLVRAATLLCLSACAKKTDTPSVDIPKDHPVRDKPQIQLADETFNNYKRIDFYPDSYNGMSGYIKKSSGDVTYFFKTEDSGQKYGFPVIQELHADGTYEAFCEKPGCNHDNSLCVAYYGEGGFLFSENGQVYIYQWGKHEKNEYGATIMTSDSKLYRVTKSGRELIAEPEYYHMDNNRYDSFEGGLIVDGYLYLRSQKMNLDMGVMKINLGTGESEIIGDLYNEDRDAAADGMINFHGNNGNEYPVKGRYGKIKLLSVSDDGNYIIFSQELHAYSSGEEDRIAVKTLSVYDNTVKYEGSCYKNGTVNDARAERITAYGRYIIKTDNANGQIMVKSAGDDEFEVVYSYKDDMNSGKIKTAEIRLVDDNRITLWRTLKSQKIRYDCVIIDLETKSAYMSDLDVKDDILAYRRPPQIFEITDSYYVVDLRNHQNMISEYALISKADYYNGTDKMISIGDVREYS